MDRATFEEEVRRDGFLEWAEFLGALMGTPRPNPPPGADVLLEIELQGARQVRAKVPDATLILLLPPSREAQEERLRRRGDPPERIARRLEVGEHEAEEGRAIADAVVVNDDLERAVEEVAAIVRSRRSAPT